MKMSNGSICGAGGATGTGLGTGAFCGSGGSGGGCGTPGVFGGAGGAKGAGTGSCCRCHWTYCNDLC